MAVVMAIAALPPFRFAGNATRPGRHYFALDGPGGFAALNVFVFHPLLKTGSSAPVPGVFCTSFMKTAYFARGRKHLLCGLTALALFFYLVCCGRSVSGLLTATPASRPGNVSNSLYLVQGLELTAMFAIGPLRRFAMALPLQLRAIGLVCAAALLVGAALGYAFIERAGTAPGKRIARRRGRPQGSAQQVADDEPVA